MRKASEVVAELKNMKLAAAAKTVEDGVAETLTYTSFPMQHWTRIRTNNAIERLNREIRRRTRVVGTFPDGHAALMLVATRCKYVAESDWETRRYLDVSMLERSEA
jgi:transposase-like protein